MNDAKLPLHGLLSLSDGAMRGSIGLAPSMPGTPLLSSPSKTASFSSSISLALLGQLLLTVFSCILEVFVPCLIGFLLAHKRVLNKKLQVGFNHMNVVLFTPCMLFSKVAFTLSPDKLRHLWIIPVTFAIVSLLSLAVAYVLARLTRLEQSQRYFAMVASMCMNTNTLPVALMQSLVITVPDQLRWDADDGKDAMLGRAFSYLMLYSVFGMILRYSYGMWLLSEPDEKAPVAHYRRSPVLDQNASERSPLLPTASSSPQADDHTPSYASVGRIRAQLKQGVDVESARRSNQASEAETMVADSDDIHFPHAFEGSRNSCSCDSPPVDDEQDKDRYRSWATQFLGRCSRFWCEIRKLMSPPIWASLAALFVACIQPLQHALEENMQPILHAIDMIGNCCIPVTLVVLGAYFFPESSRGPQAEENQDPPAKAPFVRRILKALKGGIQRPQRPSIPGEGKTVFLTIVSRMVITPILLLLVVVVATHQRWHTIFEDPVFVVSNVLLIYSPPALTLAQIAGTSSSDTFERLVSGTLFWSYCVATPPTTIIYIVLGLIISKTR